MKLHMMMKNKVKIVVGIIIFTLIIALAVIGYNVLIDRVDLYEPPQGSPQDSPQGSPADSPASNRQRAADFTVLDVDGNEVRLSEMMGKPVVLNFWASWCPSCRREQPAFDRVYQDVGEEIQFMMVNLTDGTRETLEGAKRYVQDEGYSFPVYFDTNREGATAYTIFSIPTTVFIDSEGYIVRRVQGAMDESALRKQIDEIR